MRSEMDRYEPLLPHISHIAGRLVCSGVIGETHVSVMNTGMGLTNTAISLLSALPVLRPGAVLSQGTAGAHRADIPVGQILCADAFVYGDSRKDGRPLAVETLDGMVTAIPAHERFIALGRRHALPIGPFSSGYSWNTEEQTLRTRHAQSGSLCEEMEDAAAAQICREQGIPHGSLRVISNNHLRADGGYDLSVAHTLQNFIITLIQNGELL